MPDDHGPRDHIRHVYRTSNHPFDDLWEWASGADVLVVRRDRWRALAKWTLARVENTTGDERDAWQERHKIYRRKWMRVEKRLEAQDEQVPGISNGWHPNASRVQTQPGIGEYLSVPAKLVWHTTEGSSLPQYSGSHPHFTLNPQTGALYQHVPIFSGAYALRNLPGGVETNRARAIQVELIGFASQTQGWSDVAYERIARLARWIEKHAGVERRCGVRFGGSGNLPSRLSGSAWLGYKGHIGHQHIPEQDHWDPGAFQIDDVI